MIYTYITQHHMLLDLAMASRPYVFGFSRHALGVREIIMAFKDMLNSVTFYAAGRDGSRWI